MRKLAVVAVVAVVAVLSLAAAPFPSTIPLPPGFQPEGVAVGKGTTFYTGALAEGDILIGDLRSGELEVIDEPDGRQALGMSVDERNDQLFVAGGFTGEAYVYDASTGAPISSLTLAAPGALINDVIVTREAAYFTNSLAPEIYRVAIGPRGRLGAPERLPVTGAAAADFLPTTDPANPVVNLNGIVATPNGKLLVAVHSHSGKLFAIEPESGASDLIPGVAVPSADGLVLRGHTLYAVQNGLFGGVPNQVAVIRLGPRYATATLVGTIRSDLLDTATTAALLGDRLVLANARFAEVGLPPIPPGEDFDLVILRVHGSR